MNQLHKSLALLVGLCVFASSAHAQTGRDDIRYYDRAKKKEETVSGAIQQETPGGLEYRPTPALPKTEKIAAADIIDIKYAKAGLPYRTAWDSDEKFVLATTEAERKTLFEKAMRFYQEALKNTEGSPSANRHVQFRIARLQARMIDLDPTQEEPAMKGLANFIKEYPDAWQIGEAVRTLARMYEDKGDLTSAQKTYDALANRNDLVKEVRLDFQLLAVRALIRTNQHAVAEKRLGDLVKTLAADDPNSLRVQAHLAECLVAKKDYPGAEAKLKGIITSSADGSVKGLAHNALGDCYLATGKAEDALWQYLWVDVVYNEDKHEQARALYHLSKLFMEVKKDEAKAEQCKDRLLKEKEFTGTEWQKKVGRDK